MADLIGWRAMPAPPHGGHDHRARLPSTRLLRRTIPVDARELTVAGAFMLLAGLVLPYVSAWGGFPCPLRTLTGVPCPLCGMSTSVKATLRLRLQEAFEANPAGIVAVVAAVALLVVRPRCMRVPVLVVVLGGAGMWLFELQRFSII
ncbi:MAG: DUF2752 domain-containing protein [Actinomycetota bacterium]